MEGGWVAVTCRHRTHSLGLERGPDMLVPSQMKEQLVSPAGLVVAPYPEGFPEVLSLDYVDRGGRLEAQLTWRREDGSIVTRTPSPPGCTQCHHAHAHL